MISRQRDGVVLAPLALNLSDVASHLAAEQRRRRPRFLHTSNHGFEANAMLALFLNHPPLFVAGEIALGLSLALFVRRLNRCRNPRSAWDLSVARSWPSRCDDCSSVFGRSRLTLVRSSAPRSGNEAGGSIQAAIRVAPRKRQLLRRRGPTLDQSTEKAAIDRLNQSCARAGRVPTDGVTHVGRKQAGSLDSLVRYARLSVMSAIRQGIDALSSK